MPTPKLNMYIHSILSCKLGTLQSKLCTSKNRLVLHTPIEPNQNFCSSKVRHLYYKSRSCHLRNTFPWFTQPWFLVASFLCNWSRCAKDCTHTSHNGEKNNYEFAFLYLEIFSRIRKYLSKFWWYNKSTHLQTNCDFKQKPKTHCSIWSPKYLPVELCSIGLLFIFY